MNPGAVADGGEVVTEDTSNLNVDIVGSYDIVYSATNVGGTTYKIREVIINDTTPPTITLNGSNPQTMTQNGTYVEAGAATDGGEVVTIDNSAVDPATIGSYSVTYSATDDQGNQSTATRTVNVVAGDPNAPQGGSLVGGNPLTIELFDVWADVDPGSNDATDPTNGNAAVTATVDTSNLNTDVLGTYNVTYTWTGSGGLTSTLVRSVVVVDTTAPLITLNGDNPMNVAQGSTFVDPGAYADTGETVSVTGTVDTSTLGAYTLTYTATDSSGNQGSANPARTVNVVEETTDETSGNDTWRSYNTVTVNPGNRFYFDPKWIRNILVAAGSSASGVYVEAGILNNDTGTVAQNGFLLYVRVSADTTTVTWHKADGTQLSSGISSGYIETLMDVFANGAQTGVFHGELGSDPLSYEAISTIAVSPNTQSPTDIFKFGIKVENIGSFDMDLIDPENNVQTGPGRYMWDGVRVGDKNDTTGQIFFRVDDAEDSSSSAYHLPIGNGGTSGAPPGSTVWFPAINSSLVILGLDYNTSTNVTDIQWTLAKQKNPSSNTWDTITHFPTNTTDDLSVFSNRRKFFTKSNFFSDAYRLRFYPRDIPGTVVPSGYEKGVDSGYALNILVRHGAPTVTMNGEALMFVDVGKPFNDPGATATDGATVTVASTVDTSTAGEYSVVYTALHPIGREAGTATRTVYVEDPSNPPPAWPALTAFDHGHYAGRTSSSYQTYLTIGDMPGVDAGTFGFMTYGNNGGTEWAWSQAKDGYELNVPTEIFNDAAGTQRSTQMYLTGSGVTWTTSFSNAVGTSNPYTLYSGGVSLLTDGDTVQGTHNGRTLTFRFTSTPTTIFNWPLSGRRFEQTFPSMQVGRYINVGTPTAIFEFGGKAGNFHYKVKYDGVEYAFPSTGLNFPVPQGYQVRLLTSNSLVSFNGVSGLQDYTNTAIASASSGDLNTVAYSYDNSPVNLTFYTM